MPALLPHDSTLPLLRRPQQTSGVVLSSLALLMALSACTPDTDSLPSASSTNTTAPTDVSPSPTPHETAPTAGPNTLTLRGLGTLQLGHPVPQDSAWAERGAQTSEDCRLISSPDYPGVYAIVTDGIVQRITLGQRSVVTQADGLGVNAPESAVRQLFPDLLASPHKYEDPPAKDLIAPDAANGRPAWRFEIGHEGTVRLIHAGISPVLEYVEVCA